jgi:hypothetical protein
VSQNLDKMFKQIQKNSEELAMSAMMSAANKAFELAKQEAKNCLRNDLKRKPTVYQRINPSPLWKATQFAKPKLTEKGGVCTIAFGIRYNSTVIKGAYKSNSWWHQSGDAWVSRFDEPNKFKFDSQANGIPDSGWILNNYLEGIHPGWFNGVDYGWKDELKPADVMKNFFENELHEKAGPLIYEAMQGVIIDFLKTNGGGK